MIQPRTILRVIDNSGAKKLRCIMILKNGRTPYSKYDNGAGTVFVASVIESKPGSEGVKRGDVVRAVCTMTSKPFAQADGKSVRLIRSSQDKKNRIFPNTAVLLKNNLKDMMGTRVYGPVSENLRPLGFSRIVSVAPQVL